MRFLIFGSCLLLAACDKPAEAPLSAADKAKHYLELVEQRVECDPYRQRLMSPGLDLSAVDSAYAEALRAKCVNKDI